MARPLRIEFSGAVYHVMARGNGRQLLFHEDDDYRRMLSGLEKTVQRTGWEVLSFVWMPNHVHFFFRTPQPNLSRGMQYLLSGYANWYASRYLHLNPTRGKSPLVEHPSDWPWSSYRGYARKSARLEWVRYDVLYAAWQGEVGGSDPETASCRPPTWRIVARPPRSGSLPSCLDSDIPTVPVISSVARSKNSHSQANCFRTWKQSNTA